MTTLICGSGFLGAAYAKLLVGQQQYVVVVDSCEYALYKLMREYPPSLFPIQYVLGDLADHEFCVRLKTSVTDISAVVNTAAYKHVAFSQTDINAWSQIRNNLLSALHTCSIANNFGAPLLYVSTDKAIRPTTIMGASKRCSEVISLTNAADIRILRMCNVWGSTGSLVETARWARDSADVVYVTNLEMKRHFIDVDSAASAIHAAIQAPSGTTTMCSPQFCVSVDDILRQHHISSIQQISIPIYGGEKFIEDVRMSDHDHLRFDWLDQGVVDVNVAYDMIMDMVGLTHDNK